MKRNITLLSCLFLSLSFLQAQYLPMLEENKHWVFEHYWPSDTNSGPVSGFLVNIQGDTMINDLVYQKLYSHNLIGEHNCSNPPCFNPNYPYEIEKPKLYALLREDMENGIVYAYNVDGIANYDYEECEEEYELFNFSLMIGDSLSPCVRK